MAQKSNLDARTITQEYLDSLLQKARANASATKAVKLVENAHGEEDLITIESGIKRPPPRLDPGTVPKPYFNLKQDSNTLRDPAVERAEQAVATLSAPAPPIPPTELTRSGRPLTKKQLKDQKNRTAGRDWFDLPAPEADLPRLYREVDALRLRNHLDPKRFYRKDDGEGKGIKGLPKHFAIGTIVTSHTPFGGASNDNLPRASRKRTLVEELVEDSEARAYAKRKFEELQQIREAKGGHQQKSKRKKRS